MAVIFVCKFGNIAFSNPGDYKGRNCNFGDDSQKLAFSTKYLRKYWFDLYHIFKFGRPVGADDKSDIGFAVIRHPGDVAVVTS